MKKDFSGVVKVLTGNDSIDSAYVVDDYPYGFRQRTKIRYWLESVTKKGDRFCYQTLNPKTDKWNKPKKSTYSDLGFMFLDNNNHVKWGSISFSYDDFNDIEALEKLVVYFSDTQKTALIYGKAITKTRSILNEKFGSTLKAPRPLMHKIMSEQLNLFKKAS